MNSMHQLFLATPTTVPLDLITSDSLQTTDDVAIFRSLPLLLSHFEAAADTIQSSQQRQSFLTTLQTFHSRISARRFLKLRFLLLLHHPAFSSFWTFQPQFCTHPFTFARHALTTAKSPASHDSFSSADLLAESSALLSFTATALFDPSRGVRIRPVSHHGVIAHAACYGVELVDAIVNLVPKCPRSDAVLIATRLLHLRLVHPVDAHARSVIDHPSAVFQTRRALLRHERHVRLTPDADPADDDADDADDTVKQLAHVKHVGIRMPMDMVDLQSLDFWSKGVHVKHVDNGYQYDFRAVVHPLYSARAPEQNHYVDVIEHDYIAEEHDFVCEIEEDVDDSKPPTDAPLPADQPTPEVFTLTDITDVAEQAAIVGSITVQKVFSSAAHPMIVELRRLVEGANLNNDDQFNVLQPGILAKTGDNLMQDAGVQVMCQHFNFIWKHSKVLHDRYADAVPFCIGYEVFPTSATNGVMEALTGLTSLKDFDWQAWREQFGGYVKRVNDMLSSAVGSYIAAYIMGGRDRNFDNILVQDRRYLLHIDFSYVLGRKPPANGPSISIAPEMEKIFRELDVWDKFVNMSVDAFLEIREHADAVMQIAKLLFSKATFSEEEVQAFLQSASSLNVQSGGDAKAGQHVRAQLEKSSSDVANWFKESMPETVVPIWYGMIKKGFPPATMIMSFMDAYEQTGATTLAGTDDVEIDEDEIVEVM